MPINSKLVESVAASFVAGWDRRTIARIDLCGSALEFEIASHRFGSRSEGWFRELIYDFLEAGAAQVPFEDGDGVVAYNGDGVNIALRSGLTAFKFSVGFQEAVLKENLMIDRPEELWLFRIGIVTAESPKSESLEWTKVRAVRYEGQADGGGMMIDESTWCQLPEDIRRQFAAEETFEAKCQRFKGRRWLYPRRKRHN